MSIKKFSLVHLLLIFMYKYQWWWFFYIYGLLPIKNKISSATQTQLIFVILKVEIIMIIINKFYYVIFSANANVLQSPHLYQVSECVFVSIQWLNKIRVNDSTAEQYTKNKSIKIQKTHVNHVVVHTTRHKPYDHLWHF